MWNISVWKVKGLGQLFVRALPSFYNQAFIKTIFHNWNWENVHSIYPLFQYSFICFSSFPFYSNMHPAFILLLPGWLLLVAQRQKWPVSSFQTQDQDHECEPKAGSCPHACMYKRQWRRDEGGKSETREVQKRSNKTRGERMARTAWHLNRGFPLCTSSSLHSLFT